MKIQIDMQSQFHIRWKIISNYPTYHKKCFNCYDDKDKLNKLDIELNFDKTDVDTSNKM